jgi:CheY-like chemotaxis protein
MADSHMASSFKGHLMIVFLTKDLMMSSSANSHARQHQTSIKTVATSAEAIAMIHEDRPHLLLVDLQTPGIDVKQLGEEIRGLADSVCPLTIAYAQHVNVELLQEARAAGFDQVLTRGQFNSQIGQIVAESG